MITLYTFGPMFGLPDPSPFCMKALAQVRMSGLEHQLDVCDPRKAPKGKGPWMDDDGTVVADSTFIRWHLESQRDIDFDRGLSDEQKAVGWALEKMCEEHLYWSQVWERWMIDENFSKGPIQFFEAIPGPVRGFIAGRLRKGVERNLEGQGFGRHSHDEIVRLVAPDLEAIARCLGDKPWLFGDEPTGTDAAVHGFISGSLTEFFDTPVLAAAQKHDNLIAFRDRGMAEWFPEGK